MRSAHFLHLTDPLTCHTLSSTLDRPAYTIPSCFRATICAGYPHETQNNHIFGAPRAPQGRDITAQGEALGRMPRKAISPERAKHNMGTPDYVAALQAAWETSITPRATPWAAMCRPFRAFGQLSLGPRDFVGQIAFSQVSEEECVTHIFGSSWSRVGIYNMLRSFATNLHSRLSGSFKGIRLRVAVKRGAEVFTPEPVATRATLNRPAYLPHFIEYA